MPDPPQNLYWDSCVFLAYVNEEPDRVGVVTDLLESSSNDEIKIFTSDLSRVEVAFSTSEQNKQSLDAQTEARIDNLWDDYVVTMVDFHIGIAGQARSLMRHAIENGWQMKPYDAVHLATAQWLSENGIRIDEFHTFDDRLDKFAPAAGFEVLRPYTQNPRLLKD